MAPRITTDAGKTGYVIVALVATPLLSVLAFAAAGSLAGTIAGALLLVLAVGFAARLFRGDGEAVEPPRELWRMTARPTSGFVVGGVFLLRGAFLVVTTLSQPDPASTVFSAVVSVAIGAAFVRSSLRLRALER